LNHRQVATVSLQGQKLCRFNQHKNQNTLEYRYLGNSGLKVSELCFGVMTFTGSSTSEIGSQDQQQANGLTSMALDLGINFFDTADVYSGGISEIMLGKALGSRRKDAVVASKVRFRTGNRPNDTGLSRHHIIENCNTSLERLGTDYLDLYQIHSYDPGTPLEETLSALDSLIKSGKVRYIGCFNLSAWQTMKALAISEKLKLEKFITTQLYYSIGVRDIEHELVPLCLDQKLGILCWSPLSGGFFTGKFRSRDDSPAGARRSRRDASSLQYWFLDEEKAYTIVDALEATGRKYDKTIAQTAVRWLLQRKAVASVIIGAKKPEQLLENTGAGGWILGAEDMDLLEAISRPQIPYPMSHQLTSDPR